MKKLTGEQALKLSQQIEKETYATMLKNFEGAPTEMTEIILSISCRVSAIAAMKAFEYMGFID